MTAARIGLIVDNPLRDLDGLVLLAWELARRGHQTWLVPMYEQSFDLRAIGADLALLNYVRSNNLDHLLAYRREGLRVGVLDTEGVGGKTPEEFAQLVGASGGAGLLDLYCVWGESQRRVLAESGTVPASRLHTTGCPRYDFCALPWKAALLPPGEPAGYVLINTNFPLVNPRFSRGAADEVEAAVRAGFNRDFAERYVRDARTAHAGVLALTEAMLVRWPQQRFVLRPHPFESHDAYRPLERHANFALRQEGTSVQWLAQARALVHLNCSTAVEAAMLGVPALSPAWLDTPALHVPGPASVSLAQVTLPALLNRLDAVLQRREADAGALARQPLRALYHDLDGRAAQRVADAVEQALREPRNAAVSAPPRPRARALLAARKLLGHAAATRLTAWRQKASESARRRAKLFDAGEVAALVTRLDTCAPPGPPVRVATMAQVPLARPHLASGGSICIALDRG